VAENLINKRDDGENNIICWNKPTVNDVVIEFLSSDFCFLSFIILLVSVTAMAIVPEKLPL
jgi:hypothetical protein